MDAAFEDVFSECNIQQRLDILGYGSRDAYLEAELTIETKARTWWSTTSRMCSQRLQGAGGRDVTRGCRALQEARGRRARGGGRKAGAGRHGQAGPGPPQGDEDGRRDLRTPQRPAHLKEHSDSSRHEASIKSFKLAFGSEEDGVTATWGSSLSTTCCLPASMRRSSR